MAHGYPDFEGDKSGLYLIPDWAAKEGKDKNFDAHQDNAAWNTSASVAYTVPAGKTLVITQVSGGISATNEADSDNNQMCKVHVLESTSVVETLGGNGGAALILAKPRVCTAGLTYTFIIWNRANHNCAMWVVASGYEY